MACKNHPFLQIRERNCKMEKIPPWSDLPQELLSAIAESLRSNPIDILNFRCVCKSWCSSSSSISSSTLFHPLPLVIPTFPSCLRSRCYIPSDEFSTLSVTVAYAIRPPFLQDFPSWMPKVWVVFVDQTKPSKLSIRHPFSQYPYFMPINFPVTLDLLAYQATELGRFYNLSYLTSRSFKRTKPYIYYGLVRKVVLLSIDGRFFVVVLSDDGKLGLRRLVLGDKNENLGAENQWEIIHDGKGFRFDDIVDFKGRLLGIDRRGRVYKIEIGCSSPIIMNVIVPPIAGGGGRRKRLVESMGCLYLVVRCMVCDEADARFKVYELKEDVQKWVEVNSLGGRTFFFGLEFSFSVSAEKLHGSCGKNCIVFKKESFLNYNGYDDDSALFNNLGSSDLHIGVWSLEDVAHLGVIGSHHGYSDVFWPPPSWIWQKDKSERLGALVNTLELFQRRIPNENLKARYEKLTPQQKEGAIELTMQTLKTKELLNQVRHINKEMKEFEMMAVSLKQQCNSENLLDQVGTSTLGNKEQQSFKKLQKTIRKTDCDFGWFSMEKSINACILQYEETIIDIENALIAHNF